MELKTYLFENNHPTFLLHGRFTEKLLYIASSNFTRYREVT